MAPKEKAVERVWVRVAVNMARVHRGQLLLVDPADEKMRGLIASGALTLEEPEDV